MAPKCTLVVCLVLGVANAFVAPHIPDSGVRVAQQRRTPPHSALVLSDVDTMTLNWVGLAVGTLASMAVMKNPDMADQIRKAVSGSSSPVLASAGTATLSPPPPPAAAVVKKETVAPVKQPETPTPPVKKVTVVSTSSLKETQKEIKETLQQVNTKLQSTTPPVLDKIYTEPYSDQVKRPIKQKSRVLEKLSKKCVMPWKRWGDL